MLVGRLVNLIPLSQDLAQKIMMWRNRPEVYDSLFNHRFITPELQQEWYNKVIHDDTKIITVIEEKANSNPVGMTALNNIDYLHRTAESSFFIGEESCRGKGYAYEAEYLKIKYGFENLNLNKIYAYVLISNIKSANLHKKLGFYLEGTLRNHVFHRGSYEDVLMYGLLANEYEAKKQMLEKGIKKV